MKWISEEDLKEYIIRDNCDEGCGYIDERDIIDMEWVDDDKFIPLSVIGHVLDKIRAEIIKYEGDCRLSVDEYPSCKQCTDNTFETIYAILDKYKAESEVENGMV